MATGHHGGLSDDGKRRLEDILSRFAGQGDGTARRAYPEGRLGAHDEGELAYAVGVDERHGVVLINFNKPVSWLGLGPDDAVTLAQCLLDKARALGATVSLRL